MLFITKDTKCWEKGENHGKTVRLSQKSLYILKVCIKRQLFKKQTFMTWCKVFFSMLDVLQHLKGKNRIIMIHLSGWMCVWLDKSLINWVQEYFYAFDY